MIKLIALASMFIDHAGKIASPQRVEWMVVAGRFAFPLFAFLVVRNAFRTRNAWRYLGMMLLFAVISQPIYAAARNTPLLEPLNVLFTLALGLLSLILWRRGWWFAIPVPVLLGHFVEYRIPGVALMLCCGVVVSALERDGAAAERPGYWLLPLAAGAAGLWAALHLNAPQYAVWVYTALALAFSTVLVDAVRRLDTRLDWRGGRLFFYVFYPAHLALLMLAAPLAYQMAS